LKLLFDSSVWIEHLRHGALEELIPLIRGRFLLWVDSVVAAELVAGCRSKRERQVVVRLLKPFVGAGRIVTPVGGDFQRAGAALSRLRERGRSLSNPGGALLDGLIAACAMRIGGLLVTVNWRDFAALREELPIQVESLDVFTTRLAHDA